MNRELKTVEDCNYVAIELFNVCDSWFVESMWYHVEGAELQWTELGKHKVRAFTNCLGPSIFGLLFLFFSDEVFVSGRFHGEGVTMVTINGTFGGFGSM